MLVEFEHNRMVQTTRNFELLNKTKQKQKTKTKNKKQKQKNKKQNKNKSKNKNNKNKNKTKKKWFFKNHFRQSVDAILEDVCVAETIV